MASQNLWFYRDQVFRIAEESLEVSLVICNSELSEFTLAKIFDIFYQILPTGFVLNTGYWPFYNTLKKKSICICARYGIDCRHFKHDHHWIDLESVSLDNSTVFSSRLGQLCLLKSETEVTPVTGGTAGYNMNIKLTFQYKRNEKGRQRRKRDAVFNINLDQPFDVAILSRFNIQREYYPAVHTIMFQPSPFFYETYGTLVPRLVEVRPSVLRSNLPPEMNQRYYTVSVEHMPHFSLVLNHVNLPLFLFSKNVHAVLSHLEPSRIRRATQNRGCQTEENDDISELWKYKEMIENLKPLWSDSRAPSFESLFNNGQTVNVDCVFDTYILDDKQIPGSSTTTMIKEEIASNVITEPILSGIDHLNSTKVKIIKNEIPELPTSTCYDKEYDVQWPKWGYQKNVSKKRGRKRNQNMLLYRDVVMGTQTKFSLADLNISENKPKIEQLQAVLSINENNNENEACACSLENITNPTYATVLKNPKADNKDFFEYTAETKARVYEMYKDDPEFQWFESQFPDPVSCSVPLTDAERNENFEIAEELVREESERERNKAGINKHS